MTTTIENLKQETDLRTIEQCGLITGTTPDRLRSAIWCQNFPLSAVGGWGENMRINPQTLATELEARKSGHFPNTNLRVMCP
jgi:hypothetical protein